MEILLLAVVALDLIVITVLVFIIALGVFYLNVKPNDTFSSRQVISEGIDDKNLPSPEELPLDQFKPDTSKRIRVVYKETPQGIEEAEESY